MTKFKIVLYGGISAGKIARWVSNAFAWKTEVHHYRQCHFEVSLVHIVAALAALLLVAAVGLADLVLLGLVLLLSVKPAIRLLVSGLAKTRNSGRV